MTNRRSPSLDAVLAGMLIGLMVSLVLALAGWAFLAGYALGHLLVSLWA